MNLDGSCVRARRHAERCQGSIPSFQEAAWIVSGTSPRRSAHVARYASTFSPCGSTKHSFLEARSESGHTLVR